MRLFYDIIADKRDGKKLSKEDLEYFLNSYLNGIIEDYQMAAMLMAVFIRGLDGDELAAWTERMLHSGKVMDFSHINGIKVDKHSTGGVGDKISIPLAPILAVLGFKVPMISGRGLGHTGGTLDKLESIPGFNVNLPLEKFEDELVKTGVSLIGQTPEIAPLDKKLYALRDVTGTVESIPLISSSIMSKKMAEGIDGLILDVKVGNGAFMKTMDDAVKLAETMKMIGEKLGKKVGVVFSNMNEPLGYKIGNSLEIEESIEVLKGKYVPQVSELTEMLAAVLLKMFGKVKELEDGFDLVKEAIHSGKAFEKFVEIVEYQGGNPLTIKNPHLLPQAHHKKEVVSLTSGWIKSIDSLAFGKALVQLGGGRARKEDDIDFGVGFVLSKKVGDRIEKGDIAYTIHFNSEEKLEIAENYLINAIAVSDKECDKTHLILGHL